MIGCEAGILNIRNSRTTSELFAAQDRATLRKLLRMFLSLSTPGAAGMEG
jgi:hypothetical protein